MQDQVIGRDSDRSFQVSHRRLWIGVLVPATIFYLLSVCVARMYCPPTSLGPREIPPLFLNLWFSLALYLLHSSPGTKERTRLGSLRLSVLRTRNAETLAINLDMIKRRQGEPEIQQRSDHFTLVRSHASSSGVLKPD